MTTRLHAQHRPLLSAALGLALLAGCDSASDSAQTAQMDPVQAVTVDVRFQGRVGGEPFFCTSTYAGIGTAADAAGRLLAPKDFRFYVHDVRLVTGAGREVPVAVAEDGVWQRAGVTLIDLEDGTGTCAQGNPGTNAKVVGTVPAGSYAGLRFKVGVPLALNHLNVATQPAPLNYTAMFWSWTSGYRFMRIEGVQPGGAPLVGAIFHLGSTACTAVDASDPTKGSTCLNGNRPEVDLAAFDVATDKVTVDLADLWSATDLTTTHAPSGGCMSSPADVDCIPVFPKLGLSLDGSAAGAQTLFKKN
jgi:uncharacterized repeat protein (TIGR04052 family)